MNIRVNAQSNRSGQWCQGEIVGYASCYDGRIDAVILVDHTGERDPKTREVVWTKSDKFFITDWVENCDPVGTGD